MRNLLMGVCVLALAGCEAETPRQVEAEAIETTPAETASAAITPDFTDIPDWRAVEPEDMLVIETARGQVVIELNDTFAPNHSARMRQAARDGFFDGRDFYRVIDGFVAQGGRGEEADSVELPQYPALVGEFTLPGDGLSFTAMSDPDLYAEQVGHVDGFPAGRDSEGRTWLLHCPGTMAMARNNEPDTGDVEFYIVIGHAPRHLDRIMSVFGRVISGMEHVQALNRGNPAVNSGVIEDPTQRDPIVSMRVGSDIPQADRPAFEVMRTDGQAFHDAKSGRRNRTHEFFFETPPAVIEACHMPGPVRAVSTEEAP
jgi:peptidylprolyl isomerase